MKKGALNIMLNTIIGLIIGIGLVFILFYFINVFLFPEGVEEKDLPEFQYQELVKLIEEIPLGIARLETYSSTRNFMLVGFSKDINIIEELSLTNQCGKYPIIKDLEKPATCLGKGCLCLCKVDTTLAQEFSGDLIVDCESEEIKCNAFEQSVVTSDECNYLMYYHTSKSQKELLVAKNNEKIIVTPQP